MPEVNGAVVKHFKWEDDFSLARQQSFDMVPKNEFDWIMWLDTDDTLMEPETLQAVVTECPEDCSVIFLRYGYYYNKETGVIEIEQWRERLMRADQDWRWRYTVHEVCNGRPGTKHHRDARLWVRHERNSGQADKVTRERNRKILARSMRLYPDEPRYGFYFAGELMAEVSAMEDTPERDERIDQAIKLYEKFINRAQWNDDAYVANCRIADLMRAKGQPNEAMDVDLQGVKLYPTWPSAYIGIMRSCLEMKDWDKLIFWSDICIDKAEKPESTQVFMPSENTWQPYLMRGIAYDEKGDGSRARMEYRRAAQFAGAPIDEIKQRTKAIGVRPFVSSAPTREATWGKQPGKSIAFVTRPLFEPWHPVLEDASGAGGAETAIMRLAPQFVAEGWRVAVFGTPGQYRGDHAGVEYWDASEYDPREEFTFLVSSRAPEVFDAANQSMHNILWLHDVNIGPELSVGEWGKRKIDLTIALSTWHHRHLRQVYEDQIDRSKMAIFSNGIDTSLTRHFVPEDEREPHRFVYASSPDRGIDVVLGIWPEIKDAFPDAELHVYYGWTMIDKIIGRDLPSSHMLAVFKTNILMQLDDLGGEDGGVYWHDRIPQRDLAKEISKASFWLYPTYFMETNCITALEMQLAGVYPIVTPLAALNETVVKGAFVKGYPNNMTFRREYVDTVKRTVYAREKGLLDQEINTNALWARQHDWQRIYKTRWKPILTRMM